MSTTHEPTLEEMIALQGMRVMMILNAPDYLHPDESPRITKVELAILANLKAQRDDLK